MISFCRKLGQHIGHKSRSRTTGTSRTLGELRLQPQQVGAVAELRAHLLRLLSDQGRAHWGNQGGFALGRRQGVQMTLGETEMVVAEVAADRRPEEDRAETQETTDSEPDSQQELMDR